MRGRAPSNQQAGYDAQIRTLNAVGCDKIFAEKVSSVAQRAELDAALDYAREGDALVVTKLGAIAQFERELMLERQREGVATAKLEGKAYS